jgi:hypothetical protein
VGGRGRWHLYGGRYDISVAHHKMVLHRYIYPWRTSKWCSTDMSATFSRGWAHTYPWRMYMWCATGIHTMRGALQMYAPRIWGPDTPGPGARWGPLIHGASPSRCATGKMISVEHLYMVRHGYLSVEHRNVVLHR